MLTRHEVLRLQLFTRARGEAHAKMRQSFIPWAGHAHLLRTVLGGKFRDGVEVLGGSFRSEEFRGRIKCLFLLLAALDPNYVNSLVLPVGKEADAIRAGFDRV